MSEPEAFSNLLSTALADDNSRDLALAIVAHPVLATPTEPPLSQTTILRLWRIATGAADAEPKMHAFMRRAAELLLIEEMR